MNPPKVLRPLVSVALAALLLTALPTAASAGVSSYDLAVTITDGIASAVAGTTTTYTMVVSNAGPDAISPEVAPTFDQGTVGNWTCTPTGGATCGAAGSGAIDDFTVIPVGATLTYSIPVAIDPAATGTLNGAISVQTFGDTNPGNNTAGDADTLTRQTDLSITKTDGVAAAQPGEELTYTIVVSNAGPSDSTFANVGDTPPTILQDTSWTCTGSGGGTCSPAGTGGIDDNAVLPVGASATYTLTATVDPEADGSAVVANSANVQTAQGFDLNLANNLATDVDQVADFTADLVALKTAPATAVVGGTISYTVGVRNDGPDLARDVVLADDLPTGTTFVSATQTTGPAGTLVTPAVGSGGTVEASFDTLANGAIAQFTVVVQLGGTIDIGDAVVNTAEVESLDEDEVVETVGVDEVEAAATIDPNAGNDDITVTTLIVAQATTTTSTTSTTLASTTTTARVGSGALARTGSDAGGPTGSGMVVLGAGLVLVGAAELRRRRATM